MVRPRPDNGSDVLFNRDCDNLNGSPEMHNNDSNEYRAVPIRRSEAKTELANHRALQNCRHSDRTLTGSTCLLTINSPIKEEDPRQPNPKIARVISKNIFSRLYLFFHADVDCSIVPKVLEDFVKRGIYDLDEILRHLQEFQCETLHKLNSGSETACNRIIAGKIFTFLVGKSVDEGLASYVHGSHIELLASIVLNQDDCFEELLGHICRNQEKANSDLKTSTTSHRIKVLEQCLLKINRGESSTMHSLDQRMACGETPVTLAARFRCACALHLLLRHGASVKSRWLCFNNAFDVLLFAPHQVYVTELEKEKIRACLEVLLRASNQVQIVCGGGLTQGGLVPFIPEWKDLLPDDGVYSPRSLEQQCRVQIRSTLHKQKNLPTGIPILPLPNALKHSLDLLS